MVHCKFANQIKRHILSAPPNGHCKLDMRFVRVTVRKQTEMGVYHLSYYADRCTNQFEYVVLTVLLLHEFVSIYV